MSDSNLKIDESKLTPAPSIFQKIKNVVIAIILGAVLVQMVLFYGSVKSGSFAPGSIIIYFDSIYFIGYLTLCGIMGWIGGQDFLDWLKVKMGAWKFW
jgi:predicted phage tail protein